MFSLFANVLSWLNGKKTILGSVLQVLTAVVAFFQNIHDPLALISASLAAKVAVGISLGLQLVGLVHKLFKYLGWE